MNDTATLGPISEMLQQPFYQKPSGENLIFPDSGNSMVMIRRSRNAAFQSLVFRKAQTAKDLENCFRLRYRNAGLQSLIDPHKYVNRGAQEKFSDGAHHYLAHDTRVVGSAKLVTGQQFPMDKIFPDLAESRPEGSAELSRLIVNAACKRDPEIIATFLGMIYNDSIRQGIRRWYIAGHSSTLKYLLSLHIPLSVAGEKKRYMGSNCRPVYIDLKKLPAFFAAYPAVEKLLCRIH